MTLLERVLAIESELTLDGDYQYELEVLEGIERDIPTYRRLGTPVWKAEQAKEEIARVRAWIKEELNARLA